MNHLDEMIQSIVLEISMLKEERKDLNKKVIQNRQSIASMRNTLKKLKEAKEAEK